MLQAEAAAVEVLRVHAARGNAPMYRNLIAWQKAIILTARVYDATSAFPKEELYGLISQLRRAAVSVPSNIAEGQGRRTPGEIAQFLGNARGSLLELKTQLLVAEVLGFVNREQVLSLLDATVEIMRLVNGLLKSTQRRAAN
jgi:four helix bundle protein